MINHPAFKALPDLGQFSKNGIWEEAWKFSQHASPTKAEIIDYLAGATEVAFEAFFDDAFFGARISGAGQDVAEFSISCVNALHAATDGASFFSHLSHSKFLGRFGREMTFAEIGAVNAWQSTGSIKIDAPYEALQKFDSLWSTLTSAPLARNATHGKAIEFAGTWPLHHWFALPISSKEPPFTLHRERLYNALQAFVESSIRQLDGGTSSLI